MNSKKMISFLLLAFVAVSVVLAVMKLNPRSAATVNDGSAVKNGSGATELSAAGRVTGSLADQLGSSKFTAVYFHAPHRCPTCKKIEAFAHEALQPELQANAIAWQVADYTSDTNAALVDQFKVFTSTVVLVEVVDGKVLRWKNLEEVWNHTSDQSEFSNFINRAWSEFKAS